MFLLLPVVCVSTSFVLLGGAEGTAVVRRALGLLSFLAYRRRFPTNIFISGGFPRATVSPILYARWILTSPTRIAFHD